MDRDAAGTYETQFVSQSDDEGNLYNVEKILDERGKKYLVQWEGIDPDTKRKWKPDWVLKTDCTDDLIADWKKEKEQRKRRAVGSKRSSSASGSVTSHPPATKVISKLNKSNSKMSRSLVSPPPSEARSNSSSNTATSQRVKQKSSFVIQLPARRGTKRARESEAGPSSISPVKRLRLNGPASPLPASPFDSDDGGLASKKRPGPVTYKKHKTAIGKSPLSKKAVEPLSAKINKITAPGKAISSRAKPLFISSPRAASVKESAASRSSQSNQDGSATEDEDSDPQLPEPRKRDSSKVSNAARPTTRSQHYPKQASPEHPDSSEPFVRPHSTTCARTRPLPIRNPAANRATLRDVARIMRDGVPPHIQKSISAKNKFPTVVTGSRGKSSADGDLADGKREAGDTEDDTPAGRADLEMGGQPKSPLASTSKSDRGPAKTASLHADETASRNVAEGEGERVMSSVESENVSTLSQQGASNVLAYVNVLSAPGGSTVRVQSQGNSSKGTVVPDSQIPQRNSNAPTQDPLPAKLFVSGSPSPIPTPPPAPALAKSKSSNSHGKPKLRPSEAKMLGKMVIKPRVSVARTESTLIESVPPELAGAQSGSEYDPSQSKPASRSSSSENGGQPAATPRTSEDESGSETEEIDSNADEEEVAQDGPSTRTRSQSFSQSKPKYQPLWDDALVKVKALDLTGQVSALLPREDGEEQEPIPTSSPSLGGGRLGSPEPASLESPTRHRKVDAVLQSPARSSQQAQPQMNNPGGRLQKGSPAGEEPVTQETIMETERESSPAWSDSAHGEDASGQTDSPCANDVDQSLVHAMEIDELLAGDISRQLDEDPSPAARPSLGIPDTSVIDLSDTTVDASQSVLVLGPDQSLADHSVESTQATGPCLPIASQPHSQPPDPPSSLPQTPEANAPAPVVQAPNLVLDPSPSQQLSNPLSSAPGSHGLLSQSPLESQAQSGRSQAFPQPPAQETTHSSIEEPSSWTFAPPGQVPRPADTISSFTPTNPSARAPRSSGEHLPSSLDPTPASASPEVYEPEAPRTQSDAGFQSQHGMLAPVPDLSVDIFRREPSPGSDIDQFDSPPKTARTFQQDDSPASGESSIPRGALLGFRLSGYVASHDGNEGKKEMVEALKEAEVKLTARDHRIVELTAELEHLSAEKSRAAAIFRANMAQSESIVQQQQEAYAAELEEHKKTIADLQLQLSAVQTRYEIAESQRAASYKQYTFASDATKALADENEELKTRLQLLEKQLSTGLQQWQRGFELNMDRKEQEIKELRVQLDLEREIRARTNAQEVRRRAAEWYELKKRVEDLEVENLEVEREASAVRKRELEFRQREQELEQRIKTLEVLQPSQSQGDPGMSQDDMQTETLLSDRSAALADLDGPMGDDMVWMCTYRDASDKLCGQAFDSMGLLMTHVLDTGGHKVDAGCQCG